MDIIKSNDAAPHFSDFETWAERSPLPDFGPPSPECPVCRRLDIGETNSITNKNAAPQFCGAAF